MNFNPNKNMANKKINKPRDTRYVLKNLGKYFMRYKIAFLIAIILSILANLLALTGPKLSGDAIDAIEAMNGSRDYSTLLDSLKLMGIFYLTSSILSYILSMIMITLSQKIVRKMRDDVFSKLVKLPISFFDKYQIGDILSRVSYDIDTINLSISSDVVTIATSFITILTSFIMMLIISPILICVFIVTIPVSILITRKYSKRNRKNYRERNISLGDMNGYLEEKITGLKTIQTYNQEENTLKEFDKYNDNASNATYKAEYYAFVMGPSVDFINNITLALIAVFGAILLLYQKITLGKISSFVLYSRKFSGPINEIANIITDIQSAFAAAERVFNLIDEKTEIYHILDEYVIKDVNGVVEAKNVSFGYVENRTILHNVSFKANKGETIAIVGPTGAGKTTLISLLMRFYEINEGQILLDGNDIGKCELESVRKSYAMVLQDTWLFSGTIYENVLYGSEGKTQEDVVNACKIAKIHNFIESLPDGYNTVITEEGINISKGQKQLLTIARAMLHDKKMLILDEATSNVDTKTEQEIQASMLKLMQNKTSFVIAHRLSTIRNANLILVVKDGDIVEQGTHESLLNKKGFYYELYNSQF